MFYTDQSVVYEGVIPAAQHKAINKLARKTTHIERFNNTLRQRVSRLVRETLSFSRKLANHIGCDEGLHLPLQPHPGRSITWRSLPLVGVRQESPKSPQRPTDSKRIEGLQGRGLRNHRGDGVEGGLMSPRLYGLTRCSIAYRTTSAVVRMPIFFSTRAR